MRVGLDVMGGDFAPEATVKGAILARRELSLNDSIVLIGDRDVIQRELKGNRAGIDDFEIIHTSQVIEMGEQPIKSFTKKHDSSITIGFKMLKNKKLDAFTSAGNSGAMMVGSIYSVNTIQGVIRPVTTTVLPQENGGVNLLLDIGTNPDARADVMYQFAILGSLYAVHVLGIGNPRIGLLNIGEEEEKGNLLAQSVYQMLVRADDLNFIGNIEPRDMFKSRADVVVCDGFTGNIALKMIEAMYRLVAKRGLLDDFMRRFNYENYGGSPVLGINGTVILGHGISNDTAIKNMILLARNVHTAGLPQKIKKSFKKFTEALVEKSARESGHKTHET